MKPLRIAMLTLVGAVLALGSAACGGSSKHTSTSTTTGGSTTPLAGSNSLSGTITFDGIWTASSGQKEFQDVIRGFNKLYPKVKVNYKPVGNNLPTVLATAVAGGNPPDMADIAQPGTVNQFVSQGKLKPITYASGVISKNFAPAWKALGTFDGNLYALTFKAANKSLVWYNVPAFKTAGVKSPETWSQLLSIAKTIHASGTPPYSIGGADGWTLTDLFENIYLRTFGPTKYEQLAAHKIKWTDSSVITALKTMGQILGNSAYLAGGTSGALQHGFNDSVTNAFGSPPKAAMVFEADFVAGVILSSTKAKPGSGFNLFPFPTIKPGPGASAVEIAGDMFVTFRDTPAIRAFVNYLATAPAAEIWARQGGFGTGNKNVPASIYPDAITRASEAPILNAKSVVFDMSDSQPPAFGATTGQGLWGLFQQFLRNPKDATGVAEKLESAATAAYKKSK